MGFLKWPIQLIFIELLDINKNINFISNILFARHVRMYHVMYNEQLLF